MKQQEFTSAKRQKKIIQNLLKGDTWPQERQKMLDRLDEKLARDAEQAEIELAEIYKRNTYTVLGQTICLIPTTEEICDAFGRARAKVIAEQHMDTKPTP